MISRKYTTKKEIWQTVEVADGFGGYVATDTMQKKVWRGFVSQAQVSNFSSN